MNTIVIFLFLFLALGIAAQSPDCSLQVRWHTDQAQIRSGSMVEDQMIVDELGRGIIFGITSSNTKAELSFKLLESGDCIPPGAKMTVEFDDKPPLTLSFPTNTTCLNSAKIIFMDLDINDRGLYQISQFKRLKYSKFKNIIVETNSKILTLPLTKLQKDYILNTIKCMLNSNE